MKVLYTGLKYDYGNKDNGYSFEHINFYETLNNMKEINQLDYIPTDEILQKHGQQFLNDEIVKKAKINNYDLIFFFIFKNEFYTETLNYLKKELSTPTIAWMADDHWRFENYSKYNAKNYDYYVTTDRDSLIKYKKKDINNVIFSQWGYNHLYTPSNKLKFNNKISFVGMSYGKRFADIKSIENKSKIKIDCWGAGWPNGRVESSEMFEIFHKSKINLNFTKSSNQVTIKNFIKLFLKKENYKIKLNSVKEIKDNLKIFFQRDIRQIKARIFEVTGARGFLLTENCKYIEDYFKIDDEIVIFENVDEATDKIKFYYNNERLVNKISINAQKRVLNDHTYEKRFKTLFDKVLNVKKL